MMPNTRLDRRRPGGSHADTDHQTGSGGLQAFDDDQADDVSRAAPSAIRMPISRTRWTVYESTP